MTVRVWALRLGGLALVAGAWAYGVGPGGVSPLLLPAPGAVAAKFVELLASSRVWAAVGVTALEIVLAVVISTLLGFAVGSWSSRTPLRDRIVGPLLAWGYMVPFILLYPVFVLWFGIGIPSKVAFAAIQGFFPVAYNTLRAFTTVRPELVRTGYAFGASRRQTEWLVKFPAAVPLVLAGVRIGIALCIVATIVAEVLAARRGLGYELASATATLRVPQTFAMIGVILLVVGVFHVIVQRIQSGYRT